jgi:predicted DNA-binding protein (MmcQ/YjbR family)
MQFTRRLREGVQRGEITCSVRIWTHPHVKPGGRYRLGDGHVEVDSIESIELADVTPELARSSGFDGVVDLLKTAKHGRGTNVYLVRFHYVPERSRGARREAGARAAARSRVPKKRGSDRLRARVLRILELLPDATAVAHGTHLSLEVRKKRFGYFLDDHHGDGRVALNCKSSPDARDLLQEMVPGQFHVPKYLGNKGWIGLWLDGGEVDWAAVELALREAYQLVAPKTLAQQLATRAQPPRTRRSGAKRARARPKP